MPTNNASGISSIQTNFSNMADINQDPSSLPSSPAHHMPVPLITPSAPVPTTVKPPQPRPLIQPNLPRPQMPIDPNGYPPETADIFDYKTWAIVNLVLGAIILGIPGMFFAVLTKKYKLKGDAKIAHILSRCTLGTNIFISFLFMCGMVGLITYYNGIY